MCSLQCDSHCKKEKRCLLFIDNVLLYSILLGMKFSSKTAQRFSVQISLYSKAMKVGERLQTPQTANKMACSSMNGFRD